MSTSSPLSLVVVDGRVDQEKLAELLALQAEQPQLDFKLMLDLSGAEGLVELAKDVGAMQVFGGYVVVGADDLGVPTGDMDGRDTRMFDESTLVPKLLRYLPEPLNVRTRVGEWDGHTVALIGILPHPNGYAVFHTDGQYNKQNGKPVIAFRAGDIFWRDGTRSVRISHLGMEQIVERRIGESKSAWMDEQQELRRREREEIESGYAGRDLARAPLGTVTFALPAEELRVAVLELIRADDQIALRYLLQDAAPRASSAIERDEFEGELSDVLDKLAALAALCIEYEQPDLFHRLILVFAEIYSLPLGPDDDHRFSFSTGIDPAEKAPRVFLAVVERIYGLGALAVRLRRWNFIRPLALQRPERINSYWTNWLRHALTMGVRSENLREHNGERVVEVSLLTRAAAVIEGEPALHPDTADSDAILTSLAQFDFLSNLAGIDDADTVDSKAYYTNWARFREERVQPIADRTVTDPELRKAIFSNRSDEELALALQAVGKLAHQEAMRYTGFFGWDRSPVGEFMREHLPSST